MLGKCLLFPGSTSDNLRGKEGNRKTRRTSKDVFLQYGCLTRVMSNLVQALSGPGGFWEVWSFLFWLCKLFLSNYCTRVVSHEGRTAYQELYVMRIRPQFWRTPAQNLGFFIQAGLQFPPEACTGAYTRSHVSVPKRLNHLFKMFLPFPQGWRKTIGFNVSGLNLLNHFFKMFLPTSQGWRKTIGFNTFDY